MVSLEQAAAIIRSTARAVYQQVESRRVHFSETSAGSLLICLNSLLDQFRGGYLAPPILKG